MIVPPPSAGLLVVSCSVAIFVVGAAVLAALRRPQARSARLARCGQFVEAAEVAHDAGLYDLAVDYFVSGGAPARAARSALRSGLVVRAAALYEQAGDVMKAAALYRQVGMPEKAAALSPENERRIEAATRDRRPPVPARPVERSSGAAVPSARPSIEDAAPSARRPAVAVLSAGCIEALDRVKHMEAIPASAGSVLRAVDDPKSGPNAICEEIAKDLGLMTMVLRAANSAYYGARGQVRDITQAIVLIGYDSLRELVIARISRLAVGGSDPLRQLLWKHALASAIAAQACARTVKGITVGHAFTCGLLHDVGRAILVSAHPVDYRELWAKMTADPRPSSEIERERFGTDHAEVGGAVLRSWGLPPGYAAVTRVHDVGAEAAGLTGKDARLHAIVALASTVASWLGHGRFPARPIAELHDHPSFSELGSTHALADAMAAAVEKELAGYDQIFG